MSTLTAPPSEGALWEGFLASPRRPEPSLTGPLQGQRLLVTGAGGYLGAAATRALAAAGVAHLCLLDVVEHGLFTLQAELRTARSRTPQTFVLGSVNDPLLLRDLLHQHRPTLVLHTAALKHVPMLETNAMAAATTNVLGTGTLLAALEAAGVGRLVLCSTDKAVHPVGIMGATKHLAEQLAFRSALGSAVHVLRLPNVLGSTGSVAPLFAAQIARGEPLTLTDRTATRLWTSQTEAVFCLLEALAGALPTPLAVPRQAERHGIASLAEFMLRRARVADPRVRLIGLRPGERLHEALHTDRETPVSNTSHLLQSLRPHLLDAQALDPVLSAIETAVADRNHDHLQQALQTVMALPHEAAS